MTDPILFPADEAVFAWLAGGEAPRDMPALCPGGVAPAHILPIVARLAAQLRAHFAGDSAWLIVADGEAVGLISYKSVSPSGVADIGYNVAESRQWRGHASAAVRALIDHARANGIRALTAETAIDNRASQRVLAQAGFVPVDERDDADGDKLICWLIDLTEGTQA